MQWLDEEISALEKKISQRKALTEKRLLQKYKEQELVGSSRAAKDARRERTHRLCQLGGLIEKASLGGMEDAALYGMLLQQAEYLLQHPGIESQ